MNNIINTLDVIVPIITITISTTLSVFISIAKSKSDMKRLHLSFSREDRNTLDETFSKLIRGVSVYCMSPCNEYLYNAIEINAKLLTLAPPSLRPLIIKLDSAMNEKDIPKIVTLRNELLNTYSSKI